MAHSLSEQRTETERPPHDAEIDQIKVFIANAHAKANPKIILAVLALRRHLGTMSEKIENILRQVGELSAGERADLIEALVDSDESAEFATPAIARAWDEEIERRMAAYDRGEVQAADAYKVTLRRSVE